MDANKIAKEVDEAKEVALSALKTSQKNASLSTGCTLAIVGRPSREIEIVESMDEERKIYRHGRGRNDERCGRGDG